MTKKAEKYTTMKSIVGEAFSNFLFVKRAVYSWTKNHVWRFVRAIERASYTHTWNAI